MVMSLAAHVGRGRGLIVGGIARALAATRMSPNQIASLSRSAGSPALPTAMTTRPQLASSPATAVFTSGELAIAMAMRLADVAPFAPVTFTVDEFSRALAVPGDLLGEVAEEAFQRLAEFLEAAVARQRDGGGTALGGAGRKEQERVRGRGVAVDGHAVEAFVGALLQQRLQDGGRDRRIGEDEGQHGRHVGSDHARALGEPVDGHRRRRRFWRCASPP